MSDAPSIGDLETELGRILVRAVWVDEVCADLAVELQRQTGSVDRSAVTGQSGTRLADALRKAGGDAWAREYAALYERRNGVVHGRWAPYQGDLLQVRAERGGTHAGAFTVTRWDPSHLERLAEDLAGFFDRARSELFRLAGIDTGGVRP